MDNKEKALKCHEEWNGKLETIAKSKVNSREDLAIAYTPGVAEPCKVIAEDKETYHLCIDSSSLGIEETVRFIEEFVVKKLQLV